VKRRDTREVIIGGVLGPITRPDVVIVGLYRGDDLVVGRTVPLDPKQAAELGKLLQPRSRESRGRTRSVHSDGAARTPRSR
jgi:hypothetical protein